MDTFWTIVIILVILWAVGFLALPGVGTLIHLLLVIAVIVVVYRLLTGRHILSGEKRWSSQTGSHPPITRALYVYP